MWFDPTHNLKNLFNIWSSKKRFSSPKCGTEEPNDITADFGHVIALQELESTKTVKVAHSLTSTSLYPSNIQKTSPRFALSKLLIFLFTCDKIGNYGRITKFNKNLVYSIQYIQTYVIWTRFIGTKLCGTDVSQ